MPHPDYNYQVAVLAACAGPSQSAPSLEGPAGTLVSKARAHLQYAVADVEALTRVTHTAPPLIGEQGLSRKVVLQDATRQGVLEAYSELAVRDIAWPLSWDDAART